MNRPILSICIPTYNRAKLLESALYALAPQVLVAGASVELIVSDNCSTDSTSDVVGKSKAWGQIRYHRNSENLGAAGNIMKLCNELAIGEFAWVLGDDDLVRPDGVKRVLNVLSTYPEVDYVFVNTSFRRSAERHASDRPISGADFPDLLPTKAKNLSNRYVHQWEELIDPDVDDVFLGSLMCSVFRLSRWRMYSTKLKICNQPFGSLENSYPHSVILAHTMIGRKAYYIGYPCTVAFFGEQEWLGYVPLLLTVRLQELLDVYRGLGVSKDRVEKCRRCLLCKSSEAFRMMLMRNNTLGREYFSLSKFIWRNRYHLSLLINVFFRTIYKKIPKPIYKVLITVKRFMLQMKKYCF